MGFLSVLQPTTEIINLSLLMLLRSHLSVSINTPLPLLLHPAHRQQEGPPPCEPSPAQGFFLAAVTCLGDTDKSKFNRWCINKVEL